MLSEGKEESRKGGEQEGRGGREGWERRDTGRRKEEGRGYILGWMVSKIVDNFLGVYKNVKSI